MVDADLAILYEVETRRLNEQVKRNINRFPSDFMFQLTKDEFKNLKSQNATSRWGGRRKLPNVFTEHGVLMLSSVLKSERAVLMSIQIVRAFTRMRELFLTNKEILKKLENHDEKLNMLYKHLKQLFEDKEQEETQSNRRKIGYKSEEEE